MAALFHQRCFNHAQREASGQCLSCHHFFCRECLIEHHERLICAACLRATAKPPLTRRPLFVGLLRAMQGTCGLIFAWCFYYLFGKCLLLLPSSFHEGSLWQDAWDQLSR